MTTRFQHILGISALLIVVRFIPAVAQNQIVAGVTPSAWRSLGPVNVPGTLTDLSIDPRDTRVMLVASPHGGIWRSVDSGASWFPIDTLFAQLQPGWHDISPSATSGAIARNPRNPDVLVAGLGSSLARSTDGGATWTLLPAPGASVPWLAWGPDGTLYRGTQSQLLRSTDSGSTFQVVLDQKYPGFTGVTFNPANPRTAIAGGGASVYVTTDGGTTWTSIKIVTSGNVPLVRVAYAKANPAIVYATCESELCKSTDGGATFAKVPYTFTNAFTVSDLSTLWVDPVDPAHVLVSDGGVNLAETKNGGATFTFTSLPAGGFRFVEKPGFNGTSNAVLYVATQKGLYRADNASALSSASWQSVNNGLTTTELVGMDGGAASGMMMAVTQNAGVIRSESPTTNRAWSTVQFAPLSSVGRNAVVVDQSNPNFVYLATNNSIFRSNDGGNSFSGPIGAGYLVALRPGDPNVLVTASAEYIPSQFATEVALKRTLGARAAAPSFASIYSEMSFSPMPASFSDFAYAPSRPRTAWAVIGKFGAALLRSDDMDATAPTWTTVSFPGGARAGSRVAIDPSTPETVYLIYPGAVTDTLYRTRDAGATWTDISGPTSSSTAMEVPGELPPLQPVHDLAIHPDKRTWLYAATEAGVYASEDDGGSWTFVGPTRAPVRDLFWMNRTLVAATYGRGVYSVDLSSTSDTLPSMTVDKTSLSFSATSNGSTFVAQTPAQTVRLSQTGAGTVTWTAVADQPWLTVTPASGTGSGAISVAVTSAGGVPPNGTSTGSIRVTVAGSANAIAPIAVTLTVVSNGLSTAPFGALDLPAASSTLQGSVAFSGWALDDIGVDRVELWRDLQPGETTPPFVGTPDDPRSGKVFIAIGTFVEGARPDVEAAYPTTPFRYRAGWGYLMLTWGLPNQGNGTFRFYAYAFDQENRVSLIGSRTLIGDNATATRPFGSIDTPAMGAVVSGTVVNFGWALTPKVNGAATCKIPASGVQVSVDSGPLRPVVYGDVRSDVASAFAGFSNSSAAGGHYILDTTTLANGVHTIGWLVTDDCGRADGVGSRFFTVANPSSLAASSVGGRSFSSGESPALKSRPTTERVGRDFSRGADVGRDFSRGADVGRDFSPGATRVVRVGQNERIEVPLPGDEPFVAGPLPIGASFDAATNTFMWQPVAGFLGAYDLSFTAGTRVEKLRVVVGPPIRMVIDTPHAGNVLASSGFTVAGWAVDLGSLEGAGIDALHVWAYPVSGAAPQFVGVAKSGGARLDVARLYGATFDNAGFTLTGALAPGTYDLVVYAHSASMNVFAGAETVRVIVR